MPKEGTRWTLQGRACFVPEAMPDAGTDRGGVWPARPWDAGGLWPACPSSRLLTPGIRAFVDRVVRKLRSRGVPA